MDEFGHTHSEDYLAVTVWYDAQEQLRTLIKHNVLRLGLTVEVDKTKLDLLMEGKVCQFIKHLIDLI